MKKSVAVLCLSFVCLGYFASVAFCNARTDDPLGVAVSPQCLVLGKDQGGAVTVHTAISYSEVDCASLKLNGIPVDWCHVDDLGNVVGEFNEEAVKAIVAPPEATLTLTGAMKTGETFAGSDTVRVKP